MPTICIHCKFITHHFTCPTNDGKIDFVTGLPIEVSCHSRNKTGNCLKYKRASWFTCILRLLLWR